MFQKKKSWFFLCLILYNQVNTWPTKKLYKNDIRKLIELIKRRSTIVSDDDIEEIPESVEDLPEAEPIHPGHTLLKPAFGMLKSSVKYPHKDLSGAVYGNLDNLGITYGKTRERVLYTGFRKANYVLNKLLQALDKRSNSPSKKRLNDMVIIELDPKLITHTRNRDADIFPERRNTMVSDDDIEDIPESVEDLPEAEPIHPGHTLLKPAFGMLKSSLKYPHKDVSGAVYGNLDNLGITYGKTRERVLYTGFRKANYVLNKLLQALDKKSNTRSKKSNKLFIAQVIIELDPTFITHTRNRDADISPEVRNTNNAMEVLDDPDASNEESSYHPSRRQRKPRHSKFRERLSQESSAKEFESSSDSKSSDYEHNPGNPYTVHKDKYKQNWMWNHFMDGNHMNVNPYAPLFSSMGPSGAALFFGRKWWYFNQDDFKPLN